jgi:hypothetical protein
VKGAPFFSSGNAIGQSVGRAATTHKAGADSCPPHRLAGKKIPAFRRANDTLFNVSERSANQTV